MAKPKVRFKLNEMLNKEGRTKAWLARQIGATKQQMNNWCSENGSVPSIGYILRIMKVTGWKLEDLVEEEE